MPRQSKWPVPVAPGGPGFLQVALTIPYFESPITESERERVSEKNIMSTKSNLSELIAQHLAASVISINFPRTASSVAPATEQDGVLVISEPTTDESRLLKDYFGLSPDFLRVCIESLIHS